MLQWYNNVISLIAQAVVLCLKSSNRTQFTLQDYSVLYISRSAKFGHRIPDVTYSI